MESFFSGWDGGGTKTEVLCAAADGRILLHERFGPLNLNGNPREAVEASVRDAMAALAALPGGLAACAGLCIGTAGVSSSAQVSLLRETVRACGYTGPLSVVGDQEIALAGAIEGDGAVLVAGTGSICCGRRLTDDLRVRTGGCGFLVDDGGSGYAIGRDILAAVVRAGDGRIPPTCLTEAVFAQLGIGSIPQLITWMYGKDVGKKEIASLSRLLIPALEAGDAAAVRIADKAADELAELAITAWQRLGLEAGELALNGSIFAHYPRIRARLEALCHARYPAMRISLPLHTPAEGALQLAQALTKA